jgi:hypothetical protein
MPPSLASTCFLQRNAASIARGLFTRCARPSLLSMKLHQHQFPVSDLQASGSYPGHGARESHHARPASRRGGFADRGSAPRRPCDGFCAGGKAPRFSPTRERDLPLVGERSPSWSCYSREPGACGAIPLVTKDAISGDHYPAGAGAFSFVKDAGEEGPAMVDHEVEKLVDKLQKLRALRCARERVRQLERELNGEPAKPEGVPPLTEFLQEHGPLWVAK